MDSKITYYGSNSQPSGPPVTNRPRMLHLLESKRFPVTLRHRADVKGMHWFRDRSSSGAPGFATEASYEGKAASSVGMPTVVHRQRVLGKPALKLGLQRVGFLPFSFPP